MQEDLQRIDEIQRVVADQIATSSVGVNLLLIGGFRYRLLDGSHRFSVDIDYHWDGDLQEKQEELTRYCKKRVIKEVRDRFGYEGSVLKRTGPDADSPNVASLDLRFWKANSPAIEIPIDITKIVCLDPRDIRTVSGTIHATPSDADVIEGKILALFNRPFLAHRDFVDIWLFSTALLPDSPERVKKKMRMLGLDPEAIRMRVESFEKDAKHHANAIQEIIDKQVDKVVAQQINAGGGGGAILAASVKTIKKVCL